MYLTAKQFTIGSWSLTKDLGTPIAYIITSTVPLIYNQHINFCFMILSSQRQLLSSLLSNDYNPFTFPHLQNSTCPLKYLDSLLEIRVWRDVTFTEWNSVLFISASELLGSTVKEETAFCLCWKVANGISLCMGILNSQAQAFRQPQCSYRLLHKDMGMLQSAVKFCSRTHLQVKTL